MTVECREVRRALPALLDGELPPLARDEVEEHLAGCRRCRHVLEQYRHDHAVLDQHLRAAPWLPIEERPWQRVEAPRRRLWPALVTGGNRLAAGVALIALLALIASGALALRGMGTRERFASNASPALFTAAAPSPAADVTTEQSMLLVGGTVEVPETQIVDALGKHGLVFPIGKTVEVDGRTVTLRRLAVDRTTTFLEYSASSKGDFGVVPLVLGSDGRARSAYPGGGAVAAGAAGAASASEVRWAQYPAVDPSSRQVTIRLQPSNGAPVDVSVPVDLNPIRSFLATQPLGGSVMANGIAMRATTLVRGIAVSTVRWEASVTDPRAIEKVNNQIGPTGTPEPSIAAVVAGKRLQVLSGLRITTAVMSSSSLYAIGIQGETELYGLPTAGTLRLTFQRLTLPMRVRVPASQDVIGPWDLAIDLGGSAAATATPVSTATLAPTATPISSPTVTSTPATPAPTSLPDDLYFLARTPAGGIGLWLQPADGSQPRVVVQAANAAVDAAWPAPQIGQIAYRLSGDGQALLLDTSSGKTSKATMPDGTPVTAYVPAPAGALIAYVPLDRQTLWVSSASGGKLTQAYRVSGPGGGSIDNVTWSPDGTKLLFEVTQGQGGGRPTAISVYPFTPLWQGSRNALAMAWSPDSMQLVYSAQGGIFRVNLADGSEMPMTPTALKGSPLPVIDPLAWLADGRIAFVAHEGSGVSSPASLWLMNGDGSDPWKVRDLGPVASLIWAPPASGDGFAVGLSMSGSGSQGGSGLLWYPSLHADPVPLAPDLASPQFTALHWAGQ